MQATNPVNKTRFQRKVPTTAREIARTKGERHLPGSYRLVPDDAYCARFMANLYPLEPPSGTTPLTFPGGWVRLSSHTMTADATSSGSSTTPTPPSSHSPDPPITRPCTPLAAPGASKLAGDLTRYRVYCMANLHDGHMPAFRDIISTPRHLCLRQGYLYQRHGPLYQRHGQQCQRQGVPPFRYHKTPRSSVHHSSGFLPIPELQIVL